MEGDRHTRPTDRAISRAEACSSPLSSLRRCAAFVACYHPTRSNEESVLRSYSILVRVAALDLRGVTLAIPNLAACCPWIFTDNLVCFGLS
jgi:hypothetical protein